MKKILFSILVLLISIIGIEASAANEKANETKTEKLSLVESIKKDSMTIVALRDSLKSMVSDTIVNFKSKGESENKAAAASFAFEYGNDEEPVYELVIAIVAIVVPFITLLLIVVACLIISYKKRKSRYQLIEKAIANNYQIPEYLMNDSKPGTDQEQLKKSTNMYFPNQWDGVRNGAILVAVGMGLFFAFWGSGFMMGICAMIAFIGIAKIAINWLDNRNMQRYYNSQSETSSTNSKNENSGSVPPPFPRNENSTNKD